MGRLRLECGADGGQGRTGPDEALDHGVIAGRGAAQVQVGGSVEQVVRDLEAPVDPLEHLCRWTFHGRTIGRLAARSNAQGTNGV